MRLPVALAALTALSVLSIADKEAMAQAAPTPPPPAETVADPSDTVRRLERLEELVIDLQAQTATLESLTGANAAAVPPPGSGDGGASEVQIQALSAQIADILARLQQIEARLGLKPAAIPAAPRDPAAPPGFGAVVVDQDGPNAPPPGGTYGDGRVAASPPALRDPSAVPPGSVARPAAPSSAEARALYDQGYSSLIKREYQAAETYFTQFVKLYPNDPLLGPAQFWLGEAAFISGDYRKAADNFLKSFKSDPAGDKAPESLLKLGISLKRLDQGPAACETFAELERRFPQSTSVLQRAEAEKRRSKC